MSPAHSVLRDLATIGAIVQPAGTQLVLRAGPTAVPGVLVRRVREAKNDLIDILTDARLTRWLNQHPAPSKPGCCAWCSQTESPGAVVLPFGTEPDTHTWLHAECWPAWQQWRRAEAACALAQE
jgi:hypothetical protein